MHLFARDDISETAIALQPYEPICDGFCVGYDRVAIKEGTSVSIRKEKLIYQEGNVQTTLVLDGANFSANWASLEFKCDEDFQSLRMKARFFPMQQLFPKFYAGDDAFEMDIIGVSDIGGEVHLTKDDLPVCKSGTLALHLPNALWFSIALFGMELTHGAD